MKKRARVVDSASKQSWLIPRTLNEISLERGALASKMMKSESLSINEKRMAIVHFMGIPQATMKTVDDYGVLVIFDEIAMIFEKHDLMASKTFKCSGNEYGLINLEKMTVKEYREMDGLLREYKDDGTNLHLISALLFRNLESKKSGNAFTSIRNSIFHKASKKIYKKVNMDFGPTVVKSYKTIRMDSEQVVKNSTLFAQNIPYSQALMGLGEYMLWHKKLSEDYWLAFNEPDGLSDEQRKEKQERAEKRGLSLNDIWGFSAVIFDICNFSAIELEKWDSKSIYEFFEYVCYMNQRQKYNDHG